MKNLSILILAFFSFHIHANNFVVTDAMTSEEMYQAVIKYAKPGDIMLTTTNGKIGGIGVKLISDLTNSWVGHSSIILKNKKKEWVVAHLSVTSKVQSLRKVISKVKPGHLAIVRFADLTDMEALQFLRNIRKNFRGIKWSFTLDQNNKKSACAGFIRLVVQEHFGLELGELQTLRQIMDETKHGNKKFWTAYFKLFTTDGYGNIRWDLEVMTPHRLYIAQEVEVIYKTKTVVALDKKWEIIH